MNAYELADELKRCIDDGSTDLVCVCGAVNALLEQATLIEYYKVRDDSHQKIIAELEKQQKPLSDEEIIAVFESPFHPQTTGRINDEVIAFARAIEERHGIK